jgi:hypothetical protein
VTNAGRCHYSPDSGRRSRREFLKIGALGMGGLTLPGLLRARAASGSSEGAKDTSIIWLFLNGGPSQYETFDPKPENPLPFRSVVGAVKTNVTGTLIGGLFKPPSIRRQLGHLDAFLAEPVCSINAAPEAVGVKNDKHYSLRNRPSFAARNA